MRFLDEIRRRRLLFLGGGHPRDFVSLLLHLCRSTAAASQQGGAWIGATSLEGEAETGPLSTVQVLHRVFADISIEFIAKEIVSRWVEWDRVGPPCGRIVASTAPQPPKPAHDEIGSAICSSEAPWLGLEPYSEETKALFRGRDQDVADLLEQIEHHPTVVFHGPSGAGKTSLLWAGIVPRLRGMRRRPVVLRLRFDREAPLLREQVITAVVESYDFAERPSVVANTATNLWEFFHRISQQTGEGQALPSNVVLILDQCEQLFMMGEEGPGIERTASFLQELADLCENRPPRFLITSLEDDPTDVDSYDFVCNPVKVLLSVREDFLPALLRWTRQWPSLVQGLLRLEPLLTGRQAWEVLTGQDRRPSNAGVDLA